MVQNRKPPAYQEYAAPMLANKHYRLMSLVERGLLYSLKLECWENTEIPSNETDLAKYLCCDQNELKQAFSLRVKSFFTINHDVLSCPELDDYRQHLDDRKSKQSEGGKKGAAKVNKKYQQAESPVNASDEPIASNLQVTRQASHESLVKHSTVKQSKSHSLQKEHIPTSKNDEWINDYDKSSNGSY